MLEKSRILRMVPSLPLASRPCSTTSSASCPAKVSRLPSSANSSPQLLQASHARLLLQPAGVAGIEVAQLHLLPAVEGEGEVLA
jgi:hypothetical protein